MSLVAPGAKLIVVKNTAGDLSRKDGLALHVQVGNGSLAGEFNNPASQASSTWWVSKSGVLEQYTDDPRKRMWAQGAGNVEKASIETEGYPGDPLTDAQLNTIARLLAWAHKTPELAWPLQLSDKPGQAGLGWHGEGCSPHYSGSDQWGNHPNCPGSVRLAQRGEILKRAGGGHPGPAPQPGPVFTFYNGGEHQGHPYPWDGKAMGFLNRTQSLDVGATGGIVKVLQSKLGIAKDGNFGPGTAQAVKARKHGEGFAIDVPDDGADQHASVVDWRLAACMGPAGPNDG